MTTKKIDFTKLILTNFDGIEFKREEHTMNKAEYIVGKILYEKGSFEIQEIIPSIKAGEVELRDHEAEEIKKLIKEAEFETGIKKQIVDYIDSYK